MALPVSKPLLSLQDRFSKHFHPAPKLHGRTVVVTGASRGIGLAIAYAFAAQCASRIFLVGRNEQTLLNAAEVVSKGCQTGISVHVKEGDVKDRKFWVEVMNETVSDMMTSEQPPWCKTNVWIERYRYFG